MAQGIIFGNYLLPEELFIPVFRDFYAQRKNELIIALDKKIIQPINKMVYSSTTIKRSTGATIKTLKRTIEYNAAEIYAAWEYITTEFFGNGKVQLMAVTHFNSNNLSWTNILDESSLVGKSGIKITPTGLKQLESEMKDVATLMAAQSVQDLLDNHYQDMLNTLDTYQLNTREAQLLHILLWRRRSTLLKAIDNELSMTGSTYDNIIFKGQSNKEGKHLDAFMNHMGNYHTSLFAAMQSGIMDNFALETVDGDTKCKNNFSNYFSSNPEETQEWLLDSLNTASWLTGGDIVVIGEKGNVIYNIQLKSTGSKKGKVFGVAESRLLQFATSLKSLLETETDVDKIAHFMYSQLKTTSSNNISQLDTNIDNMVMELVRKNLKLTNK